MVSQNLPFVLVSLVEGNLKEKKVEKNDLGLGRLVTEFTWDRGASTSGYQKLNSAAACI